MIENDFITIIDGIENLDSNLMGMLHQPIVLKMKNVRIANLYLFAWEYAPFIESRICLTMGILTVAHSTKITE